MIHAPYNRLKGLLRTRNLTYSDLAELLNVSRATVSNKINGLSDFFLSESEVIERFLKIDHSIFYPESCDFNNKRKEI